MSVKQVFNTSAELDYPTVLPTLDLDFANSKTLDPRITFTRASGGSYVGADGLIKYAGVNEARFDHDPLTGESLGLLVEEARTNLLLRSEEFDNSYWAKDAISIIPNQIIAPDGTLTADKIIGNSSTSIGNMARLFSFTSGTSVTYSIYAKKGEIDIFTYLQTNFAFGGTGGNRSVTFNLTNGTVQQDAQGDTGIFGRIQNVGNGWYRCIATITPTSTVNSSMQYVRFLSTGDGVSGIYIWGAQLEVGTFPTSYIPTQASTRTRAVDNAQITGRNFSSFSNLNEGTFFVRGDWIFPNNENVNYPQFSFGAGLNGSFDYFITFADFPRFSYFRPSPLGGEVVLYSGTTISSKFYNTALSYQTSGKFGASIDGQISILTYTPNITFNPNANNVLNLGRAINVSASRLNGRLSKLTYYPKALSPSNLQALTS
jgi:hypothetical protein